MRKTNLCGNAGAEKSPMVGTLEVLDQVFWDGSPLDFFGLIFVAGSRDNEDAIQIVSNTTFDI
jgi:hypothetical protein